MMCNKFIGILLALGLCSHISAQTIGSGAWSVKLISQSKTLCVQHSGVTVIDSAFSMAKIGGTVCRSCDAESVSVLPSTTVNNSFGSGVTSGFRYIMADGTVLLQQFDFYDSLQYFLIRLSVTRNGSKTTSNYLAPLYSQHVATFLPADDTNRVLYVPWDNDGYVSWQSLSLNQRTVDSYTATAVYDATSRKGLITGAIDHDTWKSEIHVEAAHGYKINMLWCLSGYTDYYSRDYVTDKDGNIQYDDSGNMKMMPHGSVTADTVRSARFMVGLYDDWRSGMEDFALACTHVVPARTWDAIRPVGWSSWGVQQTKVSYQGAIDTGDFLKDNLRSSGFHDSKGRILLSLDAWWNDNFSQTDISNFVSYCKNNNMIPGLYYGPFCYFGNLTDQVPGTNGKYTFADIALKAGGNYKKYDGAYCLDPTHPGTKIFIMTDMKKFANYGISYLKCDFMGQGAVEADSWHDSTITTGIQAYNYGMRFMLSQIKRFFGSEDSVFIDLSMSPLFPYQYAQGRRVSCDAWASIDNSKYVMNSLSYGWWTNVLYHSLDPDHLVMHAKDMKGVESKGVNRVRLTSGLVTGAFLLGDNFSDNVDAGYPSESRARALELLSSPDLFAIVHQCKAFKPVEGTGGKTDGSETLFEGTDGSNVYLAVFNFGKTVFSANNKGVATFDRLGINGSNVKSVRELWSGTDVTPTNEGIPYDVAYSDAAIYRITMNTTGIHQPSTHAGTSLNVAVNAGKLTLNSEKSIDKIALYSADGGLRRQCTAYSSSCSINISDISTGVYFVLAKFTDGEVACRKIIL